MVAGLSIIDGTASASIAQQAKDVVPSQSMRWRVGTAENGYAAMTVPSVKKIVPSA